MQLVKRGLRLRHIPLLHLFSFSPLPLFFLSRYLATIPSPSTLHTSSSFYSYHYGFRLSSWPQNLSGGPRIHHFRNRCLLGIRRFNLCGFGLALRYYLRHCLRLGTQGTSDKKEYHQIERSPLYLLAPPLRCLAVFSKLHNLLDFRPV